MPIRLQATLMILSAMFLFPAIVFAQPKTLYNGISVSGPWPPILKSLSTDKPVRPPYLANPPSVILVDVGRQLFFDDFLIERTTLTRTFHTADYHPTNPILKPDKPWEKKIARKEWAGMSAAMAFGGGVWFDPKYGRFRMWYMGGYCLGRCYAESRDGVHWTKPNQDVVPGTNIVHPNLGDEALVWMDLEDTDPAKRYKLFREDSKRGMAVYYSPDGIHWSDEVARTGSTSSPSTAFWNPFRKVWVYSIRASSSKHGRYRRYWETPDPAVGIDWDNSPLPVVGPRGKGPSRAPLWVCGDKLDPPFPGLGGKREIYNLDAVAYESVTLGLFSMLRGNPKGRPKIKDIVAAFSRDGFHWSRPFRRPIVAVSDTPGAWNYGNLQSVGGCCLVVGDKLYIYVSGRTGIPGTRKSGACSTGLAVMRRDGFASMDAGAEGGTLTTRPIRFRGKYAFVNANAAAGELRAEVLDKAGRVIAPFTRDNCLPIRTDKTLQAVRWKGGADLSALAGRPVRLRFHLKNAHLYSFWISSDRSGASYGYVAAGGPGFTGPRDTVGSVAYKAARALK